MLFAAVGVEVLGSETEGTNLRTLLLPCYLQLFHAICSCWGAGPGERYGGDESADAAVTMLFAAVGVEVLSSETTETNLRAAVAICSCCGAGTGERDGGDESADAAVTMLFAAVGVPPRGGAGERDGGDESADAVTMLFAAASVELLGSDAEEMHLRTLLFPCYLQLLGWRCWGARRRRRICGRCCCHAICSCWGGRAGERDYRDESADAAVTMLSAAVGVQVVGSDTEETNLRTL